MQLSEIQSMTHPRVAGHGSGPRHAGVPRGGARLLDAQRLEALLLNIDASLRVYSRPQLFSWTQGMLQNLVRHEMLLCALRESRAVSYQIDCFASPWIDSERMRQLFQQDVELIEELSRQWSEGEFHPVVCDLGGAGPAARGAFATERASLGGDSVMVHGTYDALGKPVSLFVLAALPGDLNPDHALLLELIAPYLHLAWMRSQLARPPADQREARTADILTAREKEILKWIHLGKSNFEIGTILGISPLTVKNHVQKILRKLNVRNRTQAVGRALALRFLEP
jgi:transcriptional regulator EpsA